MSSAKLQLVFDLICPSMSAIPFVESAGSLSRIFWLGWVERVLFLKMVVKGISQKTIPSVSEMLNNISLAWPFPGSLKNNY